MRSYLLYSTPNLLESLGLKAALHRELNPLGVHCDILAETLAQRWTDSLS